jgi:hypothetical protein
MSASSASSDIGYDSPPSSLHSLPVDSLIRDFGYDTTSARYWGDHTPANNPDHDIDYDTPEAREIAMQNARRSHAIFMGVDMDPKKGAKSKEGWTRFLPRRWSRW